MAALRTTLFKKHKDKKERIVSQDMWQMNMLPTLNELFLVN